MLFVAVVGGVVFAGAVQHPNPNSSPSSRPTILPLGSPASGNDIDGIKCETMEQAVYHVHAHLWILLNGDPYLVPASIGIPGAPTPLCFYWLHTHYPDGIIHIESPTQRIYTLGEFFDIWGMPLSRSAVANLAVPNGELNVFVNGVQFTDDPHGLPLNAHTQVVIELGKVVQPPSFAFPSGI